MSTADEKKCLAFLLDTAEDYLRDGHRQERSEYVWEDDESAGPVPADTIAQVAADVRACRQCILHEARISAVPGEGVTEPVVLVVGEAPGSEEDSTGRPFVGAAGQLLDKMLGAIELSRKTNCFIANTVKCRPPGNRAPLPQETEACAGFLDRQIALLKPRVILCMGRVAAQTLLRTNEGIGLVRGRFFDYKGSPLIATYHPSALLRDQNLKRPAWEDLKKLKAWLNEEISV